VYLRSLKFGSLDQTFRLNGFERSSHVLSAAAALGLAGVAVSGIFVFGIKLHFILVIIEELLVQFL